MCWRDVQLLSDKSVHEFLEFQERQTYASPKPADYASATDPFYIATHTKQNKIKPDDQWFKRQPIGQNKLTSVMKRMAQAAGLSATKRLTNHSTRKHLVQKLSENNIPANQIMQITGHRNIQSVNYYSHINEFQHKNISGILTLSKNQQNSCSIQQMHRNSNRGTNSSQYIFHGGLNNMFAGNIFGGTFNINIMSSSRNDNSQHDSESVKKRRRIILDSDSE